MLTRHHLDLATLVDELATRLNRTGFSRLNPLGFHEDRGERVWELRRLSPNLVRAGELAGGAALLGYAEQLNDPRITAADEAGWRDLRDRIARRLRALAKRLRGEPERPVHTWRAPARR